MSSSAPPTLSSDQARQVDALAEERFGISVEWLMEAAGWQVARFVGQRAAVVCGVGNNAGDGLAAARHLHRWGRLASVCCVDPDRLRAYNLTLKQVLEQEPVRLSPVISPNR